MRFDLLANVALQAVIIGIRDVTDMVSLTLLKSCLCLSFQVCSSFGTNMCRRPSDATTTSGVQHSMAGMNAHHYIQGKP